MIGTLKKFFDFCGEENKKKFYAAILLSVFAALIQAMRVPAAYLVIKNLLAGTLSAKVAWQACGMILISVILSSLITMKTTMLQTEAGYRAACNKRIEIAEHLRYVPMGYFNAQGLGRVASVATNTMENLSNLGSRVVMMVSKGYLTTAVILLFMFFFDWRVALIGLAGVMLFLLLSSVQQTAVRNQNADKIAADENLVSKVLEYVQGIAEVKAFNLSGSRITEVYEAADRAAGAAFALEKPAVIFSFLQNLISKLSGVTITLASIWFCLTGSMELATTVMMIVCAFMIFESLDMAGSFSTLLRSVDICVDKGNEALATPAMKLEGEKHVPAGHTLVVRDVSFSYDRRKVIDDVSLTIPEKSSTAFVGPSGGGKTTLSQLLARFWDVDEGSITLDGFDIRNYDYDSLMKNFAFVFQNVYLFSDTIANNIAFGRPGASREEIIEAAKKACCHEFISRLPDGYDTLIGEGGASLSGGERQRISIARAIMKDAPIIILDEATANVDPENEDKLVHAIEALTKEKTVVMIAHRLKTVRHADQIAVISNGRIVQRGTHEELIAQEGIYRQFIQDRRHAVSWKIAGHA